VVVTTTIMTGATVATMKPIGITIATIATIATGPTTISIPMTSGDTPIA
jgi:hypothetical protein